MILDLNNDKRVHGIIVQSPIEASSSPLSSLNGIGNQNDNDNDRNYQSSVYELISPEKDIDGLHPINQGKLFNVSSPLPLLIPCTAKGIMKLLEYYNIAINGKVAVIIGRSQIVGLPISHLLNRANATIIQCHSHTKNISDYVRMADILICAIGKPNYIKSEWLSFKTAVIDVGINCKFNKQERGKFDLISLFAHFNLILNILISFSPVNSLDVNGKIVGDVEEEQKESKELKENENFNSHYIHYNEKINIHKNVYNRVWAKSPVPGGVGPMTVAMLIDNLWLAFKNQFLNNLPFDHPIRLNLTSKNSNNK